MSVKAAPMMMASNLAGAINPTAGGGYSGAMGLGPGVAPGSGAAASPGRGPVTDAAMPSSDCAAVSRASDGAKIGFPFNPRQRRVTCQTFTAIPLGPHGPQQALPTILPVIQLLTISLGYGTVKIFGAWAPQTPF